MTGSVCIGVGGVYVWGSWSRVACVCMRTCACLLDFCVRVLVCVYLCVFAVVHVYAFGWVCFWVGCVWHGSYVSGAGGSILSGNKIFSFIISGFS